MANADSVKAKINDLISKANAKTGIDNTNLTDSVNSLIDGYGTGSGEIVLQQKYIEITTGGEYSIESDAGYDGLAGVTINVNIADYDGAVSLLINFDIDKSSYSTEIVTYSAEEGMSWQEWVESKYNLDGFTIDNDQRVILGNYIIDKVVSTDTIEDGSTYILSPKIM